MQTRRIILRTLLLSCVVALSVALTLNSIAAQPTGKESSQSLGNIGAFAKWAKIEIALPGPQSKATGKPNPFAATLDATFVAPGGKTYIVPGFYDGDGRGNPDGNVWKIRFSADELGEWKFATKSSDPALDRRSGTFRVTAPAGDAPEFYRWGRLEYVGTPANRLRYLKFRDGGFWLKAGCDDPENFLGGYPNYDTPEKRRKAIDYLADRGINSMYIMTHNLAGDDADVWPWIGATAAEARKNAGANARFDIPKLEQWRDLFEYMTRRGVVPYIVLEDDSAWREYDHARYYREIVARFGYLPALLFNFNEEHNENYKLDEALDWMAQLERIDPYDHPRGIHNVNEPNEKYVDASQVDFTSIQTKGDPLNHNALAVRWIDLCLKRNRRVLVVNFDEGRPEHDRRAWWSAYMGGGVWEAHVLAPYDRPMSTWEPVWTELGGTRAFMESLPFWEMAPDNSVVKSGEALALVKPGEAYALYLPDGGAIELDLPKGAAYEYGWWKPTAGKDGQFQNTGGTGAGRVRLAAPDDNDWALRIPKAR